MTDTATSLTNPVDDDAARAFLADAGISDPTPALITMARDIAQEIADKLREDPTLNDYAGKVTGVADAHAGLDVSDVAGSQDAMTFDHGMGDQGNGIAGEVAASVWEIASMVAVFALEAYRPALDATPWAEVPLTAHGDLLVGRSDAEGYVYVCVKVETDDAGRVHLSITGHTTNGSGGQIVSSLADIEPAPGYTREDLDKLRAYWERWHLNGMTAACEHQRRVADRMGREPSQLFTTATYLRRPEDVPSYDAMNGKQITPARVTCAVCGYAYGSAWLFETVPAEVLAFLERFTTAHDDRVRDILRTDNVTEASGEWSTFDVATVLDPDAHTPRSMFDTGGPYPSEAWQGIARAAVARLCRAGGRYVGGTSGHLYFSHGPRETCGHCNPLDPGGLTR